MAKQLSQLRKGHDFIKECDKAGWEIRRNGGSHVIVTNPEGKSLCIPDHGELHRGLRFKLVKTLTLMGLVLILIMVCYSLI